MKYCFTLILLSFLSFGSIAQNRQNTRAGTGTPTPPKPRGPMPYVMKKDYDSSMTKLNNQIRGLQSSVNAVRGGINSKDGQISALEQKMGQVEEVLNSTNFKIASTSDSLSQTRLSLEEVQRTNESRFIAIEAKDQNFSFLLKIVWGLIALAIVLPVLVWLLLNNKIQAANNALHQAMKNMQSQQEDALEDADKKLSKMDSQIRTESRNAQNYSDRLNNVIKDDLVSAKNDLEKVKSTIQIITAEITELHEKIKPNS